MNQEKIDLILRTGRCVRVSLVNGSVTLDHPLDTYRDIAGQIARLPQVHTIHVMGSSGLRNLDPLAGLSSIRTLILSHCPNLVDCRAAGTLLGLENLNITEGGTAFDFRVVKDLPRLHGVSYSVPKTKLGQDTYLTLSELLCLDELWLYNLHAPDLKFLRGLSKLRKLRILRGSLPSLKGLDNIARLEVLKLDKTNTRDVDALQHVSCLRVAWLDNASSLEFLQFTPRIEEVLAMGAAAVESLMPIRENKSIKILSVSGVGDANITPVIGHPSLRTCWLPTSMKKVFLSQKGDMDCDFRFGRRIYRLTKDGIKEVHVPSFVRSVIDD